MYNKIFVMSPLTRSGNSTVTALIGHMLATRGVETSLYYTSKSNHLAEYLGLMNVDVAPSNVSIVASSMTDTAISRQTIIEYSHHLEGQDKLHILNIGSDTIDQHSSDLLLKLTIQKPATKVVLYDISEGLDDPNIQEQLENIDCVFVVLNQTNDSIKAYKNWVNSGVFPQDCKVYPIVNMYNPTVMPIQKFAELLEVLPSQVASIHYSPFINRCTLMHALYELVPQIEKKDARVSQLYGDLEKIYDLIMDAGQSKRLDIKWNDILAKIKTKVNI